MYVLYMRKRSEITNKLGIIFAKRYNFHPFSLLRHIFQQKYDKESCSLCKSEIDVLFHSCRIASIIVEQISVRIFQFFFLKGDPYRVYIPNLVPVSSFERFFWYMPFICSTITPVVTLRVKINKRFRWPYGDFLQTFHAQRTSDGKMWWCLPCVREQHLTLEVPVPYIYVNGIGRHCAWRLSNSATALYHQ